MSTTDLIPFNLQASSTEVAGLFDPSSVDTLSSEERMLLSVLLSRDDRVDIAIPSNISQNSLWDTLALCCKVFVRVRRANSQLKLLIGRALALVKDTPEIFEARGFNSFDAFMSNNDRGLPAITGISRSELYKAKTVAEKLPELSLTDTRELGFTKTALLAQVTESGNSDYDKWLDAAKTDTIPEFRERIYRSGKGIDDGDLEWDVLQFNVTKAQKERIEGFVTDPEIIAYCENKLPGFIIERLIEETAQEWKMQAATKALVD